MESSIQCPDESFPKPMLLGPFTVPGAPETLAPVLESGIPLALGRLLGRHQLRLGHLYIPRPQSGDWAQSLLDSAPSASTDDDYIVVCGTCAGEAIFPLHLQVIDTCTRRLLREHRVGDSAEPQDSDALLSEIAAILRPFGAGLPVQDDCEPVPETILQWWALALSTGIESRVDLVVLSDAGDSDQLIELLAAVTHWFRDKLHDAYAARRFRWLTMTILSTVLEAYGWDGAHDNLKSGATPLAGWISLVREALQSGIAHGADSTAFLASLGHFQLSLGDGDAARATFTELIPHAQEYAHLHLGYTWQYAGDVRAARAEHEQVLSTAAPETRFRDIAFATDIAANSDAPTMRGLALLALGHLELSQDALPQAETHLLAALAAGTTENIALRSLAHVYRNWSIALLEDDPAAAKQRVMHHLDTLDRLYEIDPDLQDVEAAIDAAEYFAEEELRDKWLARGHKLKGDQLAKERALQAASRSLERM